MEEKRNENVKGKHSPQLCHGLEFMLKELDGFFAEELYVPKPGVPMFQGSAAPVLAVEGPPNVIEPSAPPNESVAESGGTKGLSGTRDRP